MAALYNARIYPMQSAARVTEHSVPWYGENLRRLREAAGLTREELAAQVDATARTVENWELNHRKPRLNAVLELASILKVPVESFVKEPQKKDKAKRGRPKK